VLSTCLLQPFSKFLVELNALISKARVTVQDFFFKSLGDCNSFFITNDLSGHEFRHSVYTYKDISLFISLVTKWSAKVNMYSKIRSCRWYMMKVSICSADYACLFKLATFAGVDEFPGNFQNLREKEAL
jgi:hypothetical protein